MRGAMIPVSVGWHRREVTRSGHFGMCDSCHGWLEGRPVTFVLHIRDFDGAHRLFCLPCERGDDGDKPWLDYLAALDKRLKCS